MAGWTKDRQAAGGYLHPRKVARIMAAHGYICYLCGHPDAETLDHITPWSQWTRTDLSVHDQTNLAPAHQAPCPTCRATCHKDKTEQERLAGLRAHNERTAAAKRRPVEKHPGSL